MKKTAWRLLGRLDWEGQLPEYSHERANLFTKVFFGAKKDWPNRWSYSVFDVQGRFLGLSYYWDLIAVSNGFSHAYCGARWKMVLRDSLSGRQKWYCLIHKIAHTGLTGDAETDPWALDAEVARFFSRSLREIIPVDSLEVMAMQAATLEGMA